MKASYEAAGLTEDAQAANIRLKRLNQEYKAFSEAAGLPKQRERMKVQYPWDITDIKKFSPLKGYQGNIRVVDQFSPKEYVVKLDLPTITGATKHFSDNLLNRSDRAGLTIESAQNIINDNKLVLYQPSTNTLKFLAEKGYAVLNMQGKIVTAVPEKLRKNIGIIWRGSNMAKNHDDKRICPLYEREILYGECYEVQEVRDENMDVKLLLEPIDVDKANEICEKCRWYIVSSGE